MSSTVEVIDCQHYLCRSGGEDQQIQEKRLVIADGTLGVASLYYTTWRKRIDSRDHVHNNTSYLLPFRNFGEQLIMRRTKLYLRARQHHFLQCSFREHSRSAINSNGGAPLLLLFYYSKKQTVSTPLLILRRRFFYKQSCKNTNEMTDETSNEIIGMADGRRLFSSELKYFRCNTSHKTILSRQSS